MAVATVALAVAVAVAVVVAAVFVVVTATVVCSWFRDEINTQSRHAICIIFSVFPYSKSLSYRCRRCAGGAVVVVVVEGLGFRV